MNSEVQPRKIQEFSLAVLLGTMIQITMRKPCDVPSAFGGNVLGGRILHVVIYNCNDLGQSMLFSVKLGRIALLSQGSYIEFSAAQGRHRVISESERSDYACGKTLSMTNNTLQSFRQIGTGEDILFTQGMVTYDSYHPKEMLQMETIRIPEEFLDTLTDDTLGSLGASGVFQKLQIFIYFTCYPLIVNLMCYSGGLKVKDFMW